MIAHQTAASASAYQTRYTAPVSARIHQVLAAATGALAAVPLAVALAIAAPSGSKPPATSSLPPMPESATDSAASASASAAPSASARPHLDPLLLLRSVVSIERHDKPIAVGLVLAHDGRLLTAYSALGDQHDVDVRYADGTLVHARLQDHDLGWDLALLSPEANQHSDGLPASDRDPAQSSGVFVAFGPAPSRRHVMPQPITIKGKRTLRGAGDAVLSEALELGTKLSSSQLGSPIVDDTGSVVAIVGRGCVPAAEDAGSNCSLVAFGAPIQAIRNFLRHAPPRAPLVSPWLGMQGVADSSGPAKGVRVQVVRSESPADEAGLRGGERDKADLVVAVDGVAVTTPESLSEVIRARSVGDRVSLIVFHGGKYRLVHAPLQAAPPPPPTTPAPHSSGAAAASAAPATSAHPATSVTPPAPATSVTPPAPATSAHPANLLR